MLEKPQKTATMHETKASSINLDIKVKNKKRSHSRKFLKSKRGTIGFLIFLKSLYKFSFIFNLEPQNRESK